MFSKKNRVRVRKFHRLIGVVIGVQLTIWVVSGLYFSWISIDDIRGDTSKKTVEPSTLNYSGLYPLEKLEVPSNFPLQSLRMDNTPRGFVYRLESHEKEILAFDAQSGAPLPHLSTSEATQLALQQLKTPSQISDAVLIEKAGGEYKGQVPAYRIQTLDTWNTRLYVDPWTGRIIVQRNDLWRMYDFLWGLHIMDYSLRENFNNPLIKFVSLASFFVIVSGYFLFWFGVAKSR